jgi:tetratricopeptide (TPR) repeat protein
MKNCSLLFSLALFMVWPGFVAWSQDLSTAKTLSVSGKYAIAEQQFQLLLEQQPDDAETLMASAYNYSWMGKQAMAIQQFRRALSFKQEDVNGLIGLGYAYAWDGNYINSRQCFTAILRRNPSHMDATKGLAYSYLWQGNAAAAINYFRKLSRDHSEIAEFYYGEGLAYLLQRKQRKAAIAFKQALAVDPAYQPARFQLQDVSESAAKFSVDFLAGYSGLGEGINTSGLRMVSAQAHFNKGWTAKFNYDNTLSLDLMSFALLDQQVQALSIGVVKDWNQKLLTDVDYGIRFFPEGNRQHFMKGAQVFFLPGNWQVKTGGFLGISSTIQNEWMGFVSMNVPTVANLRLEPTYYYMNTVLSPAPEHRVQLGALYRFPSGIELNAYGMWGNTNVTLENRRKDIVGWSVFSILPISSSLEGQIAIRQEKSPVQDFISIAAGLRYHILNRKAE